MRLISSAIAALVASACTTAAFTSQKDAHKYARKHFSPRPRHEERDTNSSSSSGQYLNARSKQYVVDGNNIPEVNFDVGESYAGQLSISSNLTDENAFFFWFFPSQNPNATDEIVIWLNGGPGCSSLDGLLQENGPISWQTGTYEPVRNYYSWTNLTNMVWVDQPLGTGLGSYTKAGPPSVLNETILAHDFMGFWKNFVDTFELHGRKVYITGESYAGQYIPYIAWYMLMTKNTKYFNVKGIQINDPQIGNGIAQSQAPVVQQINTYQSLLNINQTFLAHLNERNKICGFEDFLDKALTFPPPKKFPPLGDEIVNGCDLLGQFMNAVTFVNPCFNVYHLTDFCPFQWNVLGFPSLGVGPSDYFNRSDVQQALNVHKKVDYTICGDKTLGLTTVGDSSPPSAWLPLPHVIEMTNNVIIASGSLDMLYPSNGTLAVIQNMTWHGARGFHSRPSSNFFVPYHPGYDDIIYAGLSPDPAPVTNTAGSGYLGITHQERGLTWCEVYGAGHLIPQYQPGAAYRQLELLLGRISSLTEMSCFTTQPGECP